jgi:hypothetical protein
MSDLACVEYGFSHSASEFLPGVRTRNQSHTIPRTQEAMPDETTVELVVVPRKGHRFAPGHPKWGGRKRKDALPSAVATCLKLSLNPLLEMAKIFLTGVVIDPGGRRHEVDVRTRVKLLTRIAEHTHAKAPSVVAGEIDHRHMHADVTQLMRDPALADAAERIALAMLEQETEARPV